MNRKVSVIQSIKAIIKYTNTSLQRGLQRRSTGEGSVKSVIVNIYSCLCTFNLLRSIWGGGGGEKCFQPKKLALSGRNDFLHPFAFPTVASKVTPQSYSA